jgi:aspartyl-tRNA(Asn)/glutamyl-tRNA(Gln) amidotransferase subunit A
VTPTARDTAAAFREGVLTARAAVESALARLEAWEPSLHAFLAVDGARALERARELDERRARGEALGVLAGVPVAIKANMCLEGLEASCGSRILAGWTPPYTATFVRRLLDADAVVIGATNMDEFAMGSSGENSAFGPSANPWAQAYIPGGSSSGAAAAVAAGVVPIALGSDTGGSVRQPAALCGVTGMKPTYGRVSRHGLVAFASSLDQVAPLARTADDVQLALAVISGRDPLDSTSLDAPAIDAPHAENGRLDGLRIGRPVGWFADGIDDDVRADVEAALAHLVALGADLVEVDLPLTPHAIATYYVVATSEASTNLSRFDGVRYGLRAGGDLGLQEMIAATREAGFGREVKRRILLGTHALSAGYRDAWYRRALRVRRRIADDFERAFESCDLIAGPTSPTPAFRLGERSNDPVAMYRADVLTVPASLAGLPAASVPCGFAQRDGVRLPVGLQLVGPSLADERVLAAARAFQATTDWHAALPPAPGEEQ